MQLHYKILLVAVGVSLAACNKPAPIHLAQEGTIYMPQAFSTRGQLSLLLLDTPQAVVFGAAYGGLNTASTNITATFVVDTTAIAAYNLKNGTSFIPFPSSSYTIPSLTATIASGQTSSAPLTVNFTTTGLDPNTQYMLPVKMTNVSSGIFDTSLDITYFSITKLLNIYDGSYHTTGTRHNYNADGSDGGTSDIDDTRVLTTMSADSCSINTIANLGVYNGTLFYIRVNPDNTCEFSGQLQANPASPIGNQPNTTSTYDPTTRIFTVHYMYTNTNGTYRYMDEVWTPQ